MLRDTLSVQCYAHAIAITMHLRQRLKKENIVFKFQTTFGGERLQSGSRQSLLWKKGPSKSS